MVPTPIEALRAAVEEHQRGCGPVLPADDPALLRAGFRCLCGMRWYVTLEFGRPDPEALPAPSSS